MTKRVLVTGGAHRLGALLCNTFAQNDWEVWCHYHRSAEAAESLCRDLQAQGFAAYPIAADMADQIGLTGIFLYSMDAVREALEDAV